VGCGGGSLTKAIDREAKSTLLKVGWHPTNRVGEDAAMPHEPDFSERKDIRPEIAARFRLARLDAGLTIEAASKAANVSPALWIQWERCTAMPTLLEAGRVSKALGVSLDYLACF
jgi:hypothetical protein